MEINVYADGKNFMEDDRRATDVFFDVLRDVGKVGRERRGDGNGGFARLVAVDGRTAGGFFVFDVRLAEAPAPLGGARFVVTLPTVPGAESTGSPRATPGVRRIL